MRNSFNKLRNDGKLLFDAAAMLNELDIEKTSKNNKTTIGQADDVNGIGVIVERGEFGLGLAPRNSRPVYKIELTK